jgi:uncharacterized protein YjaZ
MTVITIEKAPKKFFDAIKATPDEKPYGITMVPKGRGGFQKLAVYIQEKLSQYDTRVAIAHELFHCYEYLTDCEQDESNIYEITDIMVKALKEKRKVKNA